MCAMGAASRLECISERKGMQVMDGTLRRGLAMVVLALVFCGCGGPAQIGEAPETFKAVDALYTAVSLREVKLVDPCHETLKGLHDAGKLGDDAFQSLEAMITDAKGGAWEDAQTRLSHFMQGQRRGR